MEAGRSLGKGPRQEDLLGASGCSRVTTERTPTLESWACVAYDCAYMSVR